MCINLCDGATGTAHLVSQPLPPSLIQGGKKEKHIDTSSIIQYEKINTEISLVELFFSFQHAFASAYAQAKSAVTPGQSECGYIGRRTHEDFMPQ